MKMICFNCKTTKNIPKEKMEKDPFKKYCDDCAETLGYVVKSKG